MKVVVNGEVTEFSEQATVVNVLEQLGRGAQPRGVAVAVNGEVVPKGEWRATALHDDDRIEVLNAVGGG
ncbi:MAG: sulfur carrier protein ThiS [Actinomycetota bacterium]